MSACSGNRTLIRAHESKLTEAVDALEQARLLVAAARDERDSSHALGRQATPANRRSRELLSKAARLTGTAQRLILEAKALYNEAV